MKGWVVGIALVSGLVLAEGAQAVSVQQRYDQSCGYCHTSGAAGAPEKGNASAWKPRLEKGMDTLVEHVKEGYNAMPPGGMCGQCSDQDFRSLIEYMTNTKMNK